MKKACIYDMFIPQEGRSNSSADLDVKTWEQTEKSIGLRYGKLLEIFLTSGHENINADKTC